MSLYFIIVIVIVALAFDYMNGFHDAANSIATIVATKVLTPFQAVIWAAFFNFIAPLIVGVHVADTVGKVVKAEMLAPEMHFILLSALLGAILWELITWWLGLPVSASHALIGSLAGAGLMAAHLTLGNMHGVLDWSKIEPIAAFIILSPLIGMALGYIIMVLVMWIFRRSTPRKVDNLFRVLQLLSAGAYSFGHGANDAQKTMGVISVLLLSAGYTSYLADGSIPVPIWVRLSCAAMIAIGTMFGGWKIVKTMGVGLTKLKPVGGFCAETAGAITILGATHFGIPVSTTQTITGAIIGVGATNRLSAVRWGVAARIIWAWILTMPISAAISALIYALLYFLR